MMMMIIKFVIEVAVASMLIRESEKTHENKI